MMYLRIIKWVLKVVLKAIYVWQWWIPTRLTVIAVALQFLVMYFLFGTVHTSKVQDQFADNEASYLFFFIIPIAFPMIIAVMSCFAHGKMSNSLTSVERALAFRAQKASVLPDKKVFELVKKTSALDFLQNSNSEVAKRAKSGMEATYGNEPPNKIIEDFLKDD